MAAIVAGGLLGTVFGRFLNESTQDTLTKVCGVSTLFIAVTGVLEKMLRIENGVIVSSGSMLVLICLALGGLVGEWMKIRSGNPITLNRIFGSPPTPSSNLVTKTIHFFGQVVYYTH